MKLIILAFSFPFLSTLFNVVKAQSSLTLWLPLPSDTDVADSIAVPTPTAWVSPLGTASDGSETTFLYNEIDSGDAALFGDAQTGTMVVTTSFTMRASASGIKIPDINSMSVECTLESSNTGGCVYVAPADEGGTSLVTVSETGLPVSFYAVPISVSSSDILSVGSNSAGSSAPSSSQSAGASSGANNKNGATSSQSLISYFLALVATGLVVGASLVL